MTRYQAKTIIETFLDVIQADDAYRKQQDKGLNLCYEEPRRMNAIEDAIKALMEAVPDPKPEKKTPVQHARKSHQ